eukprot:TRINITY_DN3707_c0_g1_i4.p1 TRINITY_DN3707_c0_g1~~TRINITY_DN3707_c0_g1_i4.p1  ORF type:complete len:439 (-),score=196.58 TRINITY_DN3707_c0_g1_i4:142-1458(-)
MAFVSIKTDKGLYIAGERISGTVVVQIVQPVSVKDLIVHLKGLQKVKWVATETHKNRTVVRRGGLVRHRRNVIVHQTNVDEKHNGERLLCTAVCPLLNSATLLPGIYNYQFLLQLPTNLFPSFDKERKNKGASQKQIKEWKVSITYSVKVVLTSLQIKEVKDKIRFSVRQIPEVGQQPPVRQITSPVTSCCFNKGAINISASLGKATYQEGETIQLRIDFQNNSTTSFTSSNISLIRSMVLRDGQGNVKSIQQNLLSIPHSGCPEKQATSTNPTFELRDKLHGLLFPSISSPLVQCNYEIRITALAASLALPLIVIPKENTEWANWQAPSWMSGSAQGQINFQQFNQPLTQPFNQPLTQPFNQPLTQPFTQPPIQQQFVQPPIQQYQFNQFPTQQQFAPQYNLTQPPPQLYETQPAIEIQQPQSSSSGQETTPLLAKS